MPRGCASQKWVLCTLTLAAALAGSRARESRGGDAVNDPLLSAWQPSITVQAGAGYKDNVGLARNNPESSPFARTAIEGMLLRLPVDGWQLLFYLTAEDTRFWEARKLDHEDFALAQVEVRRFWANDWQAALALEGIYFDQLIDFSITDTNLAALPARGIGTTLRPGARRELSSEVWLSLEAPVSRQLYKGSVDDYWETGLKLAVGRTYGNRSEVSLSYAFTFRGYNRAPGRTDSGAVITNSVREVSHHEVQGVWKHFWDAKRHWRSSTKLGYRHSAENESRYFDYQRYEVSHQLRFKTAAWELSTEARLAHYRFLAQTVVGGPERRRRNDLRVTARAERQLTKHLRLYAQYEHERTDSNEPLDQYAANTVGGGLAVEF